MTQIFMPQQVNGLTVGPLAVNGWQCDDDEWHCAEHANVVMRKEWNKDGRSYFLADRSAHEIPGIYIQYRGGGTYRVYRERAPFQREDIAICKGLHAEYHAFAAAIKAYLQ